MVPSRADLGDSGLCVVITNLNYLSRNKTLTTYFVLEKNTKVSQFSGWGAGTHWRAIACPCCARSAVCAFSGGDNWITRISDMMEMITSSSDEDNIISIVIHLTSNGG